MGRKGAKKSQKWPWKNGGPWFITAPKLQLCITLPIILQKTEFFGLPLFL
jgi:hypothetical protein